MGCCESSVDASISRRKRIKRVPMTSYNKREEEKEEKEKQIVELTPFQREVKSMSRCEICDAFENYLNHNETF